MVYQEKEVTLVIYTENSEGVSNQIADLDQIAEYTLKNPYIHHIVDVSFDTAENHLFNNRSSLRIRTINGRCLFTLKSSPVFQSTGAVKRDELELDWHPNSFGFLIDALIQMGIELPNDYKFDFDWCKSMSTLGMNVLQERQTKRRTKDIFCEHVLIAELAVDEVKYKYQKGDVLHREIEIESKANKGDKALPIVAEYLVQKYPDALSVWMPSKLELGLGLKDLIESGNEEIIRNNKISAKIYSMLNDVWEEKSGFIKNQ